MILKVLTLKDAIWCSVLKDKLILNA